VANLGRLDELVAGGQLEALAAGLSRLHQPPAGTRRHVGPLLIVARYLQALDVTRQTMTATYAENGPSRPCL
jgi:uncharacterized protein involved in high-affinity Fe2+ transport